jgi:hypothetical protein
MQQYQNGVKKLHLMKRDRQDQGETAGDASEQLQWLTYHSVGVTSTIGEQRFSKK